MSRELFNVEVNDGEVKRLLDRLQSSLTRDAINAAIQSGARVLYRNTQSELMKKVPGSRFASGRGAFKKDGAPVDNIRSHYDEKKMSVCINIMYDARLRWFEAGTIDRWTKHKQNRYPAHRGMIKPTFFFADAYINSTAEIEEAILKSLDQYFKSLQT